METLYHDGLHTRAAKLAAAAAALKRRSDAAAPFSLAFLTDRQRIANPEPVLRAMPPGSAVIYRDYNDPRREANARRYLAICSCRGVLFLVAGDAAMAVRIGADGVHWPRRLLPPAPVYGREVGGFVTVSCHNARELSSAAAIGADLALLSPVFATGSHPGAEHIGPAPFRALAAASPLPVLALGGVTAQNASRLAGRNVAGMAVIGAFAAFGFQASDLTQTANAFPHGSVK